MSDKRVKRIKNIWPFDLFTKTVYHRRSGVTTTTTARSKYKGHIIHKRGDGTFDVPGIDPDSVFETLAEAKRFVDYQMKHYRNPKRVVINIKNPADWFQRCVEGVESKGGVYDPQAVCGSVLRRKKARGNPTTYLVQYSILNKNYSVGFSTLKAAEKAVTKLAQHGRKATIVIQGKKSRNPIGAGLLDISPYYTAQLVDSASRGIQRRFSRSKNPGEPIYAVGNNQLLMIASGLTQTEARQLLKRYPQDDLGYHNFIWKSQGSYAGSPAWRKVTIKRKKGG